LRRVRALQNGASGGGAILPRQRALQNGAPGRVKIALSRGNGLQCDGSVIYRANL
jgi:hypothetical protein